MLPNLLRKSLKGGQCTSSGPLMIVGARCEVGVVYIRLTSHLANGIAGDHRAVLISPYVRPCPNDRLWLRLWLLAAHASTEA